MTQSAHGNQLLRFGDVCEEARRRVGATRHELVDYVTGLFPLLVAHVWLAARVRVTVPGLSGFYTDLQCTAGRMSLAAADLAHMMDKLPDDLKVLNVKGPAVTGTRWPTGFWSGLHVSLEGVGDDTVALVADLKRNVRVLHLLDSPDVTGRALDSISRISGLRTIRMAECAGLMGGNLEPLSRLHKLDDLTLSGGVTDAVLDSLSGCQGLGILKLGDRQRPAETAFTAAAVTSLDVLNALKAADLRQHADSRQARTIILYVPGEVYLQLRSKARSGGRVRLEEWSA
ncbi:hypothetical protein FJT64_027704 [Amphibalanus amphitrite]|uniref:Leucine Rich repeats (2 copies) n=1 Tax=Amphibalanus amphitrite TaxID=1232801 RepID=A0A6A4WCH7_AMPAM|nr:hypothetical protein FJT64_027704 [Amphibalanus amphitrite]